MLVDGGEIRERMMWDKMRGCTETWSVGLRGMLIACLLGTALVEPVTSQTEHVLLNCTFEDPTICNFKLDQNHSQAEWIRHRGQTPSSRTGPHGDHTTGDGYYMYMEASRVLPDSQARLQFPPLPRSTTPRCLHFSYHLLTLYGVIDGLLEVVGHGGNGSIRIWSISGNQGSQWKNAKVTIPADIVNLEFVAVRGGSAFNDIAIDDVLILGAACGTANLSTTPTSLTPSNSTLSVKTTPPANTRPTLTKLQESSIKITPGPITKVQETSTASFVKWTTFMPESTSTTLTKVKTTTSISDKTHHLEQTTAPYVPTSDNRIDCGANAIMVAIARDVVGPLGGDINLVAHLRDPQCTGKDNSSHILFTFSPDTCGTSARLTKDFVVYENDIFIKSSSLAQQQVSVSFENYVNTVPVVCKYDRKELLSISYKPHFRTLNVLEHGFGHLTFSLEQYHGVQFKVPYQPDDYPLSVDLKDQIYIRLGVRLAAANMSGMALRADSCKATSSLSPFSSEAVKLIDNGCPAMKELTVYPSNDPTEVLFGFPAFYFVRDIQQVYLHCEMQVCMQSDPTCSSSCQTPARGRRDVSGAFSSTYIVTQGPFQPKPDSKAKAAYVLAGCSIAAALTAITVAIITVTRSRRETRGYQEVATSEGDM